MAYLASRQNFPKQKSPAHTAFTLVELMVVVAIIGILALLVLPAFNAIKGATDLNMAVSGIAGGLERARAYAMANGVYVYVGLVEVSADQPPSANPQTTATATAGGRVVFAAVAARDGTRGYSLLNKVPKPAAWTDYNLGSGLVALGKLETYENIHLVDLRDPANAPPATGSMARTTTDSTYYALAHKDCAPLTPFAWPLGSKLADGQCQYYFLKVIQFDPQGIARLQYETNQDTIVKYMEIGLQQTHGSAIPLLASNKTGPIAALVLDAMTGSVRIYRP